MRLIIAKDKKFERHNLTIEQKLALSKFLFQAINKDI